MSFTALVTNTTPVEVPWGVGLLFELFNHPLQILGGDEPQLHTRAAALDNIQGFASALQGFEQCPILHQRPRLRDGHRTAEVPAGRYVPKSRRALRVNGQVLPEGWIAVRRPKDRKELLDARWWSRNGRIDLRKLSANDDFQRTGGGRADFQINGRDLLIATRNRFQIAWPGRAVHN